MYLNPSGTEGEILIRLLISSVNQMEFTNDKYLHYLMK